MTTILPDTLSSETTPTESTSLGHYQLRQCLGEGGFGQVFEAWDQQLLRSVAIKRLKNTTSPEQTGSLLREARLAAGLKHPAFVKIHALEQGADNSQSIVMELVEGQTVKQLLASGRLTEAVAVDVVLQIAQAMQAAHAAGMTHGDLKPSNLMQEPSGQIRILDFGLARQSDAVATTSMLPLDPQGTLAYMAPERLLGAPLSPLCDIYALGVILYELLSGVRPLGDLGGLALAAAQVQVSSGQWPWPGSISPQLKDLILAMTAKVPEQRLQTMGAVLAGLAGVGGVAEGAVAAVAPAPVLTSPVLPDAPAIRVVQAGVRQWQRRALGLMLAVLLAVGTWQALPWVQAWWVEAKPYSEALEMKNGLAALKLFDRPGSLESATKSFNRILEHNPQNAAAVAGLAMAYSFRYQNDGQDEIWLQKADAGAQQAMGLNDQLALSHIATAYVLLQQGKWEMALRTSERALALEPLNFFAWRAKVGALRSLRRGDDALKYIELALQHFPDDRSFLDDLGRLLIEQGDLKKAEAVLRRSINSQPDTVYGYALLAELMKRQGKNDEALQVLQQGLQIRPNAMLYGNLGNVLFARGDYLAAARAFENAVAPDKGNPADYLGWANLADTLLWIPGREAEAKLAYEKARQLLAPRLARRKNDITLLSRMALYAARTGNKPEAQALMTQALLLAPNAPDLHFRAGLAYELLGNRKMALVAIAKAKSLGYPIKLIEAEPDLVALRRDPGYFNH
jgi:eukaryotic-like serine/threonine-protein kinase